MLWTNNHACSGMAACARCADTLQPCSPGGLRSPLVSCVAESALDQGLQA